MLAFEGVLERGSGGGAYIVVPDEVLADLGRGGRFRARGRLSDVEFRSSTIPIGGGRVCLGVHKATRQAAGVDFGDAVLVEIEPDDDLGRSEVPPELSQALDQESALRDAFESAAPYRRRDWVARIMEARQSATKQRRVARIIEDLRELAAGKAT
ncbi:MAG TPA: YdeI/OmpD-associated family protein [Pseudonocardiaceae bacterium]|nr:YdeI/OmpD-associated family protein [Pseudonocardiaceae bacterium]